MSLATTTPLTLASVLWPAESISLRIFRSIGLMAIGTIALWLSAKIQVPLWPVPVTMQTFVVLVLGIAYGWRLGGATVLLYLVEGAAGLPIFAGGWSEGGGIHHLIAGPTAGYLTGFAVAAAVVGWLAERGWDRSPITTIAAMVIGNVAIYAMGVAWLGGMVGYGTAFEVGLLPFVLGDAMKVALGAIALPLAWRAIACLRPAAGSAPAKPGRES